VLFLSFWERRREVRNNMEIPSKDVLLRLYHDLLTARRVEARTFEIIRSWGGSGGIGDRVRK
jgi:hypothetical protein